MPGVRQRVMTPSSTAAYPFMSKRKGLYQPRLTVAAAAPAWSPLSLPNLVGWYDASVASSITASGGAVSQWNDLSGHNFHLTQGTGSLQPLTGSLTQNSKNVIKFDGVDDKMSNATSTAVTSTNCTLYTVWFFQTANVGGTPAWVKLGSPDTIVGMNVGSAPTKVRFKADSSGDFEGATSISGAAHQVTLRGGAASTGHIYIDGVSDATGSTDTNFPEVGVTIGGTLYAASGTLWMAECFWSNVRDTDTNKGLAEAYLKAKWATP